MAILKNGPAEGCFDECNLFNNQPKLRWDELRFALSRESHLHQSAKKRLNFRLNAAFLSISLGEIVKKKAAGNFPHGRKTKQQAKINASF